MIFKTWLSDINKVAIASDSLSGIRFDSKNVTVVTAYTNAIKGLNEEQARYVLTKRYVSEADQADLLVKAQIISATEGIKASELSRQLVLQGLRKEQADALIEQISGNEAITSNTILTKEQTAAILEQAEARKLLSAEQRQNIANDIEESASSAAEATAEIAQASSELAESTAKVGTTSSILARGVSQLGTGMKSLLSIFVSSPIAIIATLTGSIIGLTYIIGKFQDSVKNAAKDASDFASSMSSINSTYNQETQTLNELTEKYKDLREQLIEAKGNEEETYSIKSQMLELQQQLNDIYGDEYDKVNLVTDAYKDQTEELKKNAKQKTDNYLNENVDKIEEATKKMTSDYDYELGNFNYGFQDAFIGNDLHDQIKKLAEKNGIEWDDNKGFVFKGTAEEASKAINQFMTDVRELRESEDGLSDGIIDNLKAFDSSMSKQLGYADEIIKGYQETYETAQMAQIASDTNLSKVYNQAIDTVEKYNDAVLRSENPYDDENVKKAWDNLQTIKNGIKENEAEWGQYSNIMDDVFSTASDGAYSFYQTMQSDNSVSKLVDDLQGLSDTDLQSMADDGIEDSFDKLCKKANEYGLEVQDVIDLLLQLGTAQGKVVESASDETDILSFSEAWSNLKNSTDDATKGLADNLTELAEKGQLTVEALSKADTTDFFKNVGISAEEATKQINALVSSSTQLQSMSAQISKMSDMLADKKNGTTASADDLASFDVEVRGLESWDRFERVMGSSTSTLKQCQKAANDLATEWVNSNNFLSNLNDTNKDYYITQLKNMGIENAEAVVTGALTQKERELTAQTEFETLATQHNSDAKNTNNQVTTDLANATVNEIAQIIAEGNATADTTQVMAEFAMSKLDVNNIKLNTSSDIEQIVAIANAAGASTSYVNALEEALKSLQNASQKKFSYTTKKSGTLGLQDKTNNFFSGANQDPSIQEIFDKAEENNLNKDYDNAIKTANDIISSFKPLDASKYKVSSGGSNGYKPPSTGGGSGSLKSDTKQIVDWIERKISSLNNNIDLTQSKLDNLFNIKTPKGLSKQITDVSNKLKKASDNTDKWKSKLSKIKIPDSAKKLIQDGKDVNLSKYSKTEQKNIKKYQSTWKSYSSAKKKENSLYNQKWDLETQKGKEALLKSQEKDYNTLAKIEEKAYKKYMSKAKSVKLSSSLKKKVQSGDYKISDYSSKTQSLIQEYQDWWDKAQDANKGKYEAKKNARDKRIERYQLYVDDAEAKIANSQALTELKSGNYKEQNKQLEKQKKYLKESYDWQIKIAKENGKILEADKLRSEYQKELNDLTMQEFDNIANTYDNKVGLNNNKIKAFQDQISLLEAKGQKIGSALYTKQMSLNNINEKKLIAEREKLIEKLNEIPKGTDDWYKAQDTLFSIESELVNVQIENANLQKSINQLKFDRFDDLLAKLNDIVDETDFLIDMLDSENFFDDNGKITDDGITAMGMYAQKYDTYLAEAEQYKQMLADVKDMYDAGSISLDEYEEYQRKYSQSQRDAIKSANDCKDALVDLVEQGLNAQNRALEEAVNKQKELLQQEKD